MSFHLKTYLQNIHRDIDTIKKSVTEKFADEITDRMVVSIKNLFESYILENKFHNNELIINKLFYPEFSFQICCDNERIYSITNSSIQFTFGIFFPIYIDAKTLNKKSDFSSRDVANNIVEKLIAKLFEHGIIAEIIEDSKKEKSLKLSFV